MAIATGEVIDSDTIQLLSIEDGAVISLASFKIITLFTESIKHSYPLVEGIEITGLAQVGDIEPMDVYCTGDFDLDSSAVVQAVYLSMDAGAFADTEGNLGCILRIIHR